MGFELRDLCFVVLVAAKIFGHLSYPMYFLTFNFEGIGAHLVLRTMGRVAKYYLVGDIDLTLETVLPDLNPCEAAPVILL